MSLSLKFVIIISSNSVVNFISRSSILNSRTSSHVPLPGKLGSVKAANIAFGGDVEDVEEEEEEEEEE